MRTFAVALVLASVVVAAPSFADVPAPVAGPHAAVPLVWTPAMIAKVKEQIGNHERRAAGLQPIVARDVAAHDALQTDAVALDRLSKDELAQAADYRVLANTATDKKQKDEFNAFAAENEVFAKHSEQAARTHREVAQRLEETIKTMQASVTYHLDRAAKLKTALANNS